ncbi:NALCN channel auxiliary factor 1-like [Periophthalmus magnuspinnatus]|uniref:NALCN channel auxiliary factor 1-like n=1 Tax=Periophthalmus magnuspinnatus TaxID=409849 RepID=UPI00145B44DA|nr:NALCN channel auxiliary factor 1-like [Periophthalmus magnuspinnatus]
MTQGAGTCWQQEDVDGFPIWIEPARLLPDPPPCALADRGRLSWASLALLLALLSDHLWFRAEAKLAPVKLARSPGVPGVPGVPLYPERTRAVFLDNSSTPLCDSLRDGSEGAEEPLSTNSFTFVDVDHLCGNISERSGRGGSWDVNISSLYLSFCSSYSLLDLLRGASRPDRLNCSLDALHKGPDGTCSACVAAYQRYDLHALEKYEEFEVLALKYEPGPYSVRTCMDQCKMAYKWWLCAQFFPDTSPSCGQTVPCGTSCLQVQQSCPFILPDNEDLIHGGSPSFICTGLVSDSEARCCDVRWDPPSPPPSPLPSSHATLQRTASPSCEHQGAWLSSASPRLKLCPLLVLVILHSVLLLSHNATLLWATGEEGGANED